MDKGKIDFDFIAVTCGRIARLHFLKGHTSEESDKEISEYLMAYFRDEIGVTNE